jgi:hypothetical protein
MTAGKTDFNWEDDLGLFIGDTSYFGDIGGDMFIFAKDWGMANLQLVIGREEDTDGYGDLEGLTGQPLEQFLIAGLANFGINERFRAGVMGYYWLTDEEMDDLVNTVHETDTDLLTLGVYAAFAFTPDIELKGVYYRQSMGDTWSDYGATDDSASAWKAIIDVNQNLLRFTSAWLEYGQIDNNFKRFNTGTHISFGGMGGAAAEVMGNFSSAVNKTSLYGVHLEQEWNDKWRTFARYFVADYDTNNLDDTSNWTLGVTYQLNPAVAFTLAYDNIDYGNSSTANEGGLVDDDHMIRFRTFVTF